MCRGSARGWGCPIRRLGCPAGVGGDEGGDARAVARGWPRAQQVLGTGYPRAGEPTGGGGCGPGWWTAAAGDAAPPTPRQQPPVRSGGPATCGRGAEAGSPVRGSGEAATGAAGAPTRGLGGDGGEGPGGLGRSADGSRLGDRSCSEQVAPRHSNEQDEYRPAAIFATFLAQYFFSLKRRWGCFGGGVRAPRGWGSRSCGRSEGALPSGRRCAPG